MPKMSGTDFLREAIQIQPDARRVLLTAYADSNAAIEAINTLKLNHYLTKPWEPPEAKVVPCAERFARGLERRQSCRL